MDAKTARFRCPSLVASTARNVGDADGVMGRQTTTATATTVVASHHSHLQLSSHEKAEIMIKSRSEIYNCSTSQRPVDLRSSIDRLYMSYLFSSESILSLPGVSLHTTIGHLQYCVGPQATSDYKDKTSGKGVVVKSPKRSPNWTSVLCTMHFGDLSRHLQSSRQTSSLQSSQSWA